MKSKMIKELIMKYPGYVTIILGLDIYNIELIYGMNHEDGLELLKKMSNDIEDNEKKNKKEQGPVLYYSNF